MPCSWSQSTAATPISAAASTLTGASSTNTSSRGATTEVVGDVQEVRRLRLGRADLARVVGAVQQLVVPEQATHVRRPEVVLVRGQVARDPGGAHRRDQLARLRQRFDPAPEVQDRGTPVGEPLLRDHLLDVRRHVEIAGERGVEVRPDRGGEGVDVLPHDVREDARPGRHAVLEHAVGVPERRPGSHVSPCRARAGTRGSARRAPVGRPRGRAAARRPGCRRGVSRRPGS